LAGAVPGLVIIGHGLVLAENIRAVPLLPWLDLARESRRGIGMLLGERRLRHFLGLHDAGETDLCLDKSIRLIL
jgi:hypothetical protein